MRILGLHFGHDASAAVIEDGRVAMFVEKERLNRRKHAIGLRSSNVARLLDECGIGAGDIDYVAVTSTQNMEIVHFDPTELHVTYGPHRNETLSSVLFAQGQDALTPHLRSDFGDALRRDPSCADGRLDDEEMAAYFGAVRLGTTEKFLWVDLWSRARRLNEIAAADYSPLLGAEAARLGFHWPVTVDLFGHTIPGAYFAHHYSHAAYAFYQSGYDEAAVITHDGGQAVGTESGLYCYGEGNMLWVLSPHYLYSGVVYDQVAKFLGLGLLAGPGKLMGLASWGSPTFYEARFAGNAHDIGDIGPLSPAAPFLAHCVEAATAQGYDMSRLGDASHATEPVNADIAASAQQVFEETVLAAVRALAGACTTMGKATPRLCMTGGTGLNCPANSRVSRETPFTDVSVAPGCADAGLAIGSALALYHNVLGFPRSTGRDPDVYVGPVSSSRSAASDALEVPDGVRSTVPDDPPSCAADDLAADLVVGWFEGRSELGPRALGHRSILAHPCHGGNWERVNAIKGREQWRPLAPMVLSDDAVRYFDSGPFPSPFMLFTHRVTSDDLPAVTHVDGSARVQSVTSGCGRIHAVLEAFRDRTGVPVLLNTSLNGPGEPIVESPREALDFFAASALDVLYIEGRRFSRTSPAP